MPSLPTPLIPLHCALLSGDRFRSRYQLLYVLDIGHGCVIYQAQDHLTSYPVTIKISLHSLEHEAQMLAHLNRSSIAVPRLIEAGEDEDHQTSFFYLIRAYHHGLTLTHWIDDALHPSLVCSFGLQIGEILASFHRQRLVIRNVHPENFLIHHRQHRDEKQYVSLLDVGQTCEEYPTTFGQPPLHLEASYGAPEIWTQKTGSWQADIYAFGIMLHQMVTGTLPVPCTCHRTPCVCQRVASAPLANPLGGLIYIMTDTHPQRRPTAVDVQRMLNRYASRLASSQEPC